MPIPSIGQPGFGMDWKNRYRGVAFNNPDIQNIPTPLSLATNAITLTAQQVINSIVTIALQAASGTLTFPTASLMRQGLAEYLDVQGVQVGDTIGVLICCSTGTLVLATGSGGTADTNGSTTIAAGISKNVLIRFTNATPGSEAYTFYA